jgi:hypothetical protein
MFLMLLLPLLLLFLLLLLLLLLQAASVSLMSAKDARLGLMGQLLAHMGVVKALGWEQVLGDKVSMNVHESAFSCVG